MKPADLIARVDEIIAYGNGALSTRHEVGGTPMLNSDAVSKFRSAGLSFIHRLYGESHPHYSEFKHSTDHWYPSSTKNGIGILEAIRTELAGGWLFSMKALVAAELFADFLEMADYLLESGYKDPAAVITGSVLEEHLRQLSLKQNVPIYASQGTKQIPRKADAINSDLAKERVYSALDQKSVTAWLDLRNKAAHGRYSEYNDAQVRNMLNGVVEFMARVQP